MTTTPPPTRPVLPRKQGVLGHSRSSMTVVVDVPPMSVHTRHTRPGMWPPDHPDPKAHVVVMLLRKEVIQPHLPVRLPCYDFVPIASPTFDSSPPYGLGHRLRVLPTFVT